MSQSGPFLTVDVIIEVGVEIVLIERKFEPLGWALPGGFVETGELVADAAVREAKEETSLEVALEELLGVYSDPTRDPRKHTVSVVFIGRAQGSPRGQDDAKQARLFPPDAPPPLVFDHSIVISDYLMYRRQGVRPPLRR